MEVRLIRSDSKDSDFRQLVQQLDQDLDDRYGAQQDFYGQFNALDEIKHVVIAYVADRPIACGAIKAFDEQATEVKRMYVDPPFRGKGVASQVLLALEDWAKILAFQACVLQLANNQAEALGLYKKQGYQITANFGQYIGDDNSICMRKTLSAHSVTS